MCLSPHLRLAPRYRPPTPHPHPAVRRCDGSAIAPATRDHAQPLSKEGEDSRLLRRGVLAEERDQLAANVLLDETDRQGRRTDAEELRDGGDIGGGCGGDEQH